MPKIRRYGIPKPLMEHLRVRMVERDISPRDLGLLSDWLSKEPEVPIGKWFKRFPRMIVCGEGEWIKTFLRLGQVPVGEEVR